MKVYGDVEEVISPRFCGTIKYCPPEAIRNDKFRAMAGEVWAMGVVLERIKSLILIAIHKELFYVINPI